MIRLVRLVDSIHLQGGVGEHAVGLAVRRGRRRALHHLRQQVSSAAQVLLSFVRRSHRGIRILKPIIHF